MSIRHPQSALGAQGRGRAAERVAAFVARRLLIRLVVVFILITLLGMLLFAQDPLDGAAILT